MTIGQLRLVWGWPGWGWRLYGVIYKGSKCFLGLSIRNDRELK